MATNVEKASLIILGITALLSSRTMFAFFDDPEGPNVLIVTVLAGILYLLSVPVYLFLRLSTDQKRLLSAIIIQLILVVGLYFFLN